jgi:hypothetical protein
MLFRLVMRWLSLVGAGALVTLSLLIAAAPSKAASLSLSLPFKIGQTWFICQGYNTSGPHLDHNGTQVHALDLSIAPTAASGTDGCVGGTSASQGQPVYAPTSGTVVSQCCHKKVNDMVCIAAGAGGVSLLIGHMNSLPAIGAHVSSGSQIGIVNPPGKTTNQGGYSHIHIAAYPDNNCGSTGDTAIPFDDAHGTRFSCAPNLPDEGASVAAQYYGKYLSRCGTVPSGGDATVAVGFTLPAISPIGVDNDAPRHPRRTVTVAVENSARQVLVSKTATATYSNVNGDWTASVDLGPSWTAGNYFVTVRLSSVSDALTQTMGRYSGSTYLIAESKKTDLPRTPLFTGDINGDGVINVLDYNILLNCWFQTGCSPNTSQYAAADLNDDGQVGQFDYNIFIRSEAGVNADCSNGLCVYNKVWAT